MGGLGGIVEADETYLWKQDVPRERKTKRYTQPTKSRHARVRPASVRSSPLSSVGGSVRSFHVENADKPTVNQIVGREYRPRGPRAYRRKPDLQRRCRAMPPIMSASNTRPANTFVVTCIPTRLEGFFSLFKRGMRGVYQHCGEKHLHRYLAEFDFRTTIVPGSASATRRWLQTHC